MQVVLIVIGCEYGTAVTAEGISRWGCVFVRGYMEIVVVGVWRVVGVTVGSAVWVAGL